MVVVVGGCLCVCVSLRGVFVACGVVCVGGEGFMYVRARARLRVCMYVCVYVCVCRGGG